MHCTSVTRWSLHLAMCWFTPISGATFSSMAASIRTSNFAMNLCPCGCSLLWLRSAPWFLLCSRCWTMQHPCCGPRAWSQSCCCAGRPAFGRAQTWLMNSDGMPDQMLALNASAASFLPMHLQIMHALPISYHGCVLCRLSSRWLLETCKAKLVPMIERLARDKDEYTASAVAALKQEVGRLVPAICAQVSLPPGRQLGNTLRAVSCMAQENRMQSLSTSSLLQYTLHHIHDTRQPAKSECCSQGFFSQETTSM